MDEELNELCEQYDLLKMKYGDADLNSIYFGGCTVNPNICFVFMNPTKRNIASKKNWDGLRSPWIGTKNIWDLFKDISVIDETIYKEIRLKKPNDWDSSFVDKLYKEITNKKVFITNLAKCTQIDARVLPDSVFIDYLELFKKEIDIISPKVIIFFGNQVSSIALNKKITVSTCRKEEFLFNNKYKCYSVYYPVGNGYLNIDKSIEDIKHIIEKNI